jgi:hypothetical protein
MIQRTKIKRLLRILIVMVGMGAMPVAYANLPVFDYASWSQKIEELKHWVALIHSAKRQLETAQSQLTNAKSQLKSITGVYGWGSLFNSAKELTNHQYTPDSWSDALKGIAGGNNQRYRDLLVAYKKAHPVIDDTQYRVHNTQAQTDNFNKQINTVKAVAVSAEMAYANVNQYLKITHDLTQKIDDNKNTNIKSAIDLNTRLVANNANLLAALIRLQAVQTNLQAQQSQMMIQSKSEQQYFFTANTP